MLQLISDTFQRAKKPSSFRFNLLNLLKLFSIVVFILMVNFGFFSELAYCSIKGAYPRLCHFWSSGQLQFWQS